MLKSRMAISKDMVALAWREAELDHQRRGLLGWDTNKLVTEINCKIYHWMGKEGEEYAGFEQYITWDWNVSLRAPPPNELLPTSKPILFIVLQGQKNTDKGK